MSSEIDQYIIGIYKEGYFIVDIYEGVIVDQHVTYLAYPLAMEYDEENKEDVDPIYEHELSKSIVQNDHYELVKTFFDMGYKFNDSILYYDAPDLNVSAYYFKMAIASGNYNLIDIFFDNLDPELRNLDSEYILEGRRNPAIVDYLIPQSWDYDFTDLFQEDDEYYLPTVKVYIRYLIINKTSYDTEELRFLFETCFNRALELRNLPVADYLLKYFRRYFDPDKTKLEEYYLLKYISS